MSTDIKRKSDENFKEYKIRLYRNQELYGLTNKEVGDLLNLDSGNKWDESAYRKHTHAYIEGYDDGYENGYSDAIGGDTSELSEELDRKKDELYIQQIKTRDKLREYRSTLRDEARIENLKDVAIECAREVANIKPLQTYSYPNPISQGKVAVLSLSDLHYGELVDDFLNTYNTDVFMERMAKITSQTIDYCKLMGVTTLKVLNLGDWISGNIHVSTRVLSEEDSVGQTMAVAEVASEMLSKFASNIPLVEFHSVTDNHSRINKNYKEHIEKESFSRFIPWYIETRVSDINNIKIIKNKINEVEEFEIGVFEIFEEKAFFTHGHNEKIATMISDLTLMTKMFPIAVFTGHLHKNFEDEVHGIDLIMNPSAIGSGEYSKKIRKTSHPRQKLTIYENNNGNVERVCTYFINL